MGKPKKIWGNCKRCGSELYRRTAVFCSKRCYTEFQYTPMNPQNKRVQKECEYCLRSFVVMNYMKNKTRFCSISCSSKHHCLDKKPNLITKKCVGCGKSYKTWPYRLDSSSFCSMECKHNDGRKLSTCEVCGNEYIIARWKDGGVCSKKCNNKKLKRNPSGLELKIINLFKNKEIEFDSEVIIISNGKKYKVDFLIYDSIIVEAFGDYWHCNPDIYDSNYYHKQCGMYAQEIWDRDANRINELNNMGYVTHILWESYSNDKLKVSIDEICKN